MVANERAAIAVVDDEAGVRTMLRRVLRQANYEVAAFASGDDFPASLAVRVPACVILDVHMPGLSGFDVLAQLRTTGRIVPAVLITASDDRALDRAVLDAGGVALLHKPFASDELLATVNATLHHDGHISGNRNAGGR